MTICAKNAYPIYSITTCITPRGEYIEEILRTFYILQKSEIIYNFSEFFPAFQRKCQHRRSRYQRLWLSFGQRWAQYSELNIPVFYQEEPLTFIRLPKFIPSVPNLQVYGENALQKSALKFWLISQKWRQRSPSTILYHLLHKFVGKLLEENPKISSF